MSKGRWEPRETPTEYRSRAPLSDALLDVVAAQQRLTTTLGVLTELLRRAETQTKAARSDQDQAA